MTTLFSREAFLAALAPVVKDIEIDEVGTVRLRQLSVAEVDDARERAKDSKGASFGLIIVAYALVGEDGQPLFQVTDLQPLAASAGSKIDKIVQAVMDLNGYGAPSPK